jgi:hypothetical protein
MKDLEFVVGRDYRVATPYFAYSALSLTSKTNSELIFVNLNDEDCDSVTIKLSDIIAAKLI